MTHKPVAILGGGNVGMALAAALITKGESVVFGVPDAGKYEKVVSALGPAARVGSTAEAIGGHVPSRGRRPVGLVPPIRAARRSSCLP